MVVVAEAVAVAVDTVATVAMMVMEVEMTVGETALFRLHKSFRHEQ